MTKKTFFIADLHLSENRPDLTALFVDFMQSLQAQIPQVEQLFILGDLFDFWIGDDERSDLISLVQQQIKQLTDQGVPCYFICGNRDFLLGKNFAKTCGLQLLSDYEVIDLYGKPTLICHGDTLCIDDKRYQQFRRKVHQKWRQWLFLRLPLKLRLKIAENIRAKSRADKQHKTPQIMDVNPEFTLSIMKKFGVTQLIHGHTHRQKIHKMTPQFGEPNAEIRERIVLGDWGNTSSVLVVTEIGMEFVNHELK